MTEEILDPCEIIDEPEPNPDGSSEPEPPEEIPPERSPGFPVESVFEEVPGAVVRDCVMIPQQFYYIGQPKQREEHRPHTQAFDEEMNLHSLAKDYLVDTFRYRAGKVYDHTKFSSMGTLRFVKESNTITVNVQEPGGMAPWRTNLKEAASPIPGRPDILVTGTQLLFPQQVMVDRISRNADRILTDNQIRARYRAYVARTRDGLVEYTLQDPSRPLEGYRPPENWHNPLEFSRLLVDREQTYEDFTFKVPAAFFEGELTNIEFRPDDYASVKVGMPEFTVYPGDGLNDEEIVQITREADGVVEVYIPTEEQPFPELRKHSLYRKYAIDYGISDGAIAEGFDRRPYGGPEADIQARLCPSNDRVQKFPAKRVEKIVEINSLTTTPTSQPDFFSWAQNNLGTYAEINFNMAHKSNIAAILKETDLDTLVFELLDKSKPSMIRYYTQILDQKFGFIEETTGVGINDTFQTNFRPNRVDEPIRRIKLGLGQADGGTHASLEDISEDEYPLSFIGSEMLEQNRTIFKLWNFLATVTAKSRLEAFTAGKERTLNKALSGQPCYSEVIAYRVEKSDTATGQVLQDFYFSNNPDTYDFRFLDNQVMFGREYTYKIYTINFVIGAKYVYQNHSVYNDDGTIRIFSYDQIESIFDWESDDGQDQGGRPAEIFFDAMFKRTYSLIEAPYFQQTVLIGDRPPLTPDVQFLPNAGDDTSFRLLFTPSPGHIKQEPIAILPGDEDIIREMFLAQNASRYGALADTEKIEYKSDTPPTHYQMLVIKSPPTGYESFLDSRVFQTTFRAPFFNVSVEPNVEYYAVFRAKDKAGISNPSEIYKMVINSYPDGMYPTFEIYRPEQRSYDQITFERIISLNPSNNQSRANFMQQQEISNEDLTLPDNFYDEAPQIEAVNLGDDPAESIWNKKYKIRVTSQTSGRMFDINIDWAYRHVEEIFDSEGSIIKIGSVQAVDSALQAACFEEATKRLEREVANQRRSDIAAGRPGSEPRTSPADSATSGDTSTPATQDPRNQDSQNIGSTSEEDTDQSADLRDDEDFYRDGGRGRGAGDDQAPQDQEPEFDAPDFEPY